MNDELFSDLPESPSPKLAWLRKHGLGTHFDPREKEDLLTCPETGQDIFPWVCGVMEDGFPRPPYGKGETEEEAILDYCQHSGIAHYSLE